MRFILSRCPPFPLSRRIRLGFRCAPSNTTGTALGANVQGEQLFVITMEPFFPASRDISKWIVAAILAAGPEALAYGNLPWAHDTWNVSTSWALFSGVSIQEIHRAAYWRSPNLFISFNLRDVPADEPSFSRAAISAAAGTL